MVAAPFFSIMPIQAQSMLLCSHKIYYLSYSTFLAYNLSFEMQILLSKKECW